MSRAKQGGRKLFVALLLALALPMCAVPSAVWAKSPVSLDDDDDTKAEDEWTARRPRAYDRSGFYIGAGATYALQNFDIGDEEDMVGRNLDPTNAWGGNARVGYRFHPMLAAELGADYLHEFEFESSAGMDNWRLEGAVVTANGKVFFLANRVQPYLILGAGVMCMNLERGAFNNAPVHDADRTEFAGRGGLGFDFYLFDNVVLFGEAIYVQATGALADYPFAAFAFGALYRFP